MSLYDQKKLIEAALAKFGSKPLFDTATSLFKALGYESTRHLRLKPNNFTEFLNQFSSSNTPLNQEQALAKEWRAVEFLFQITDDEVRTALGDAQLNLFSSQGVWDNARMESYLFFAIELKGERYTRTRLATATRAINRLFDMPAMLLFKHGQTLSLAVIHRRLNKKDSSKDVLEKITLIKDIRFSQPHRAHIDILFDLSISELARKYNLRNFVDLHAAWQKTLNIQALNKRFFIEIRNWFHWARLEARFPGGAKKDADNHDSEALIRLLTRMIFCWFLREKHFIPEDLFLEHRIEMLLQDWRIADCERDTQSRYYKAILQNLFFATLNTPIEEREFRSGRSFQGKNKHYGDQRFFRHVKLFKEKAPVEDVYKSIPFLNGGLFENLDEIPNRGDPEITEEKRVDGFSDTPGKQPLVPDFLFFGGDREVPKLAEILNELTTPIARGLLCIFRDYKFTIEENTPLEQDIALDPELLGRAFENLLAEVNQETRTIARKSTGSFYTPREIVNYMVEEALVRHLLTVLKSKRWSSPNLEDHLRELISAEKESHQFSDTEADAIVEAIGQMRILDPACGSGAFPMGLLQHLVQVLHKLDPGNARWKAAKLASLPPEMRQKAEVVFREESFDYTRKLELIKDCIHGVDIQPSAIQISKLRFFLSLVIEQNNPRRVRPLPNLETKFVCANTLLGLPRREHWGLFQHQIEPIERELLDVRSRYFFAQDQKEKDVCRAEDRRLRRKLSDFIDEIGGSEAHDLASAVAAWDPYKPDRVAEYFDAESMFGNPDGFDITIGNPPYVRADEPSDWNQRQRRQILASQQYATLWEKWDLFVPFIERAYNLLKPGGITTLIVSDAFCHSKYAQKPQNWYLKNARILRLDFCSNLKIFDAAVYNLIYFFQKSDGTHHKPERRFHHETFGNVTKLTSDEQEKLTYRTFFPEDTAESGFNQKTIELNKICYITIGMVVNAHEDLAQGAFTMEDLVQDFYDTRHPKRFVEGKHLGMWLPNTNRWLEWGTRRAPALFRRPTFPEIYETNEKILVQRSPGPDPKCCYDDKHLYFTESTVSFLPWHLLQNVRNRSLLKTARYYDERKPGHMSLNREEFEKTSRRFSVKYLLGVMNSSAARDFLRSHRRSNIHLYPDDWKKLPIPDVSSAEQAPIINLVDQILTAKGVNPSADISSLEDELDAKVNALYGITTTPSESSPPRSTAGSRPFRVESGLKEQLRDLILPSLRNQGPYFSVEAIYEVMKGEEPAADSATMNRYLIELVDGGFIFDAGRGWYSFLKDAAKLDREPVSKMVTEVRKAFPLLRFAVWSTVQVNPWMHHLIGQPVLVLDAEKDALDSIADHLEAANWKPTLNPRGNAAKRFTPNPRAIILRPLHSAAPEPVDGFASPEQLLVELRLEAEELGLMAVSEFQAVATRLATERRLTIATMLRYAKKRRLNAEDLFENQLTALFSEFTTD